MKSKRLCLVSALLLLVGGCRVPVEYGVNYKDTGTPGAASTSGNDNSDLTPEQQLALLDGKREPGTEKPYAEVLDKLESKCYESRYDIAVMVFATVKQEKEQGFNTEHLEMLKTFFDMTESGVERKQGSCNEVWKSFKESNEELEKADR